MQPIEATTTRVVRIGGLTKDELLTQLQAAGVRLNEAGQTLFADERFTTAPISSSVEVVETAVAGLGLPDGATFARIVEQAAGRGLTLCPLELGPHLRLQFTDQPEGHVGQPPTRHRAPPGSLTVASAPLADDEDTPKGFYLRRIEGALWLRGYRAPPEHHYWPEDRFAFRRANV